MPVPLIGASGLPWNSIVFGTQATFESWRGRTTDGRMHWPPRQTWADMKILPTRPRSDLLVFAVPFFPESIGGSNSAVAAGTYDSNIQDWAAALVTAGWNHNKTVIRLAWENNLDSNQYAWSSSTYTTFISAWQRFVTQARTAGLTNVLWNWSLNKGPSGSNNTVSWTVAYPGDAYVDVIGIDPYDIWPPSFNESDWAANIAATGGSTGSGKNPGLQGIANFVRSHGKQMSIDEWGVMTGDAVNFGGDNPFYIAKMFDFIDANSDIMAWESYFDFTGTTYSVKLSDDSKPLAGAQYKLAYPEGWGPDAAPTSTVWTETFDGTAAGWPTIWSATTGHSRVAGVGQQITPAATYATVNAQRDGVVDAEVSIKLQFLSTTEQYHAVHMRWVGSSGYGTTVSNTSISLRRHDTGAQTILASVAFAPTANSWYNIRMRTVGSQLRAKIWLDGTTEPSSWTVSAVDSTYTTAGVVMLLNTSGASATAITANWDDASLTDLSGSAAAGVASSNTVEYTATAAVVTIATSTPVEYDATPASSTIVASDTVEYTATAAASTTAVSGTVEYTATASAANPPSAGADQTNIEPYSTVTLTATDSDSSSVTWTQFSGSPTVTLSGSGSYTRTFIAPATLNGTTLTFVATDSGGLSDSVSVSVLAHNEWVVNGGILVPYQELVV